MDIKHIIAAIAVTSMGIAYCELPPVPEGMEVYDAERDGISYEDEVAAGRTPTPTDYNKAEKLMLQINPNAMTREKALDYNEERKAKAREKDLIQPKPVRWVRVMP